MLVKRLLSTPGEIDVRPGGIRGERTFSDSDEPDENLDTEYQRSEDVADPDPLPNVPEEAEEWGFDIGGGDDDE